MFERVDQWWRVAVLGICFCIFNLGGLCVSITIFPLIITLVRNKGKREALTRRVIKKLFRFFTELLRVFGVLNLEFRHVDKLSNCRGTVVIANHPTLIDIILIVSVLPNPQCIVKFGLWRSPFLGLVVRSAGFIRNDGDPEKLLEDCVEAVKKGENLVIFPEGTRTRFDRNNRFQRGFANIALRAGSEIQCISLNCMPVALAKTMSWYEMPKTRPQFKLEVGERVDVAPYLMYRSTAIGARRLTAFIENTYVDKLSYERT